MCKIAAPEILENRAVHMVIGFRPPRVGSRTAADPHRSARHTMHSPDSPTTNGDLLGERGHDLPGPEILWPCSLCAAILVCQMPIGDFNLKNL